MKKLVVFTLAALLAGSASAMAGSSCCSFSKTEDKTSESTAKVNEAKKAVMVKEVTTETSEKMASAEAE